MERCLLSNDTETGVCIMKVGEGLDDGDIISTTKKEIKMLSQDEKAKRYEIIERGIQKRIQRIQDDLMIDLKCSLNKIPLRELEQSVEEEMKYYLDELFAGQTEPFYLFDCMISENAPVSLTYGNPHKRKIIN